MGRGGRRWEGMDGKNSDTVTRVGGTHVPTGCSGTKEYERSTHR